MATDTCRGREDYLTTDNWLDAFLVEASTRQLCTRSRCSTCGNAEFRDGLAETSRRQLGNQVLERDAAIQLATALRDSHARGIDEDYRRSACLLVLQDLLGTLTESELAEILQDTWSGLVLHESRRLDALARRREHEQRRAEEVARNKTVEKKRRAQEKHQARVQHKQDREQFWRGGSDLSLLEVGPRLLGRRLGLHEVQKETSGVYAFFLLDGVALPGIVVPTSPAERLGLLYVGMTHPEDDAFRDHVGCKHSGGSTFRRTLGALLKRELRPQLTAIPRAARLDSRNWTNYRFQDAGEAALTTWMRSNLRMTFVPAAGSRETVATLEGALIRRLEPPLNLTHWKNPQQTIIKSLRRACAGEARSAAQMQPKSVNGLRRKKLTTPKRKRRKPARARDRRSK